LQPGSIFFDVLPAKKKSVPQIGRFASKKKSMPQIGRFASKKKNGEKKPAAGLCSRRGCAL
jgi:hypothetical protein